LNDKNEKRDSHDKAKNTPNSEEPFENFDESAFKTLLSFWGFVFHESALA